MDITSDLAVAAQHMPHDADDRRALFQRVVDDIVDQIRTGKLAPGDVLPTARRMADTYSVASMTAQRALRELQHRGLTYAVVGKGTFVHPQAPQRIGTDADGQPIATTTRTPVISDNPALNRRLALYLLERDRISGKIVDAFTRKDTAAAWQATEEHTPTSPTTSPPTKPTSDEPPPAELPSPPSSRHRRSSAATPRHSQQQAATDGAAGLRIASPNQERPRPKPGPRARAQGLRPRAHAMLNRYHLARSVECDPHEPISTFVNILDHLTSTVTATEAHAGYRRRTKMPTTPHAAEALLATRSQV